MQTYFAFLKRAVTQHHPHSGTESWRCLILSQPWRDYCGSQGTEMPRVWNGPSSAPCTLNLSEEGYSVPFSSFNCLFNVWTITIPFWQALSQNCDHFSVQESIWLPLASVSPGGPWQEWHITQGCSILPQGETGCSGDVGLNKHGRREWLLSWGLRLSFSS